MSIPLFVVVQGLIIGATYGLLALGLVLVYKSNRVLNFAHGEVGVIAAVLFQRMVNGFGIPYWVALPIALVIAAGLGAGVELLLRRLFNAPRFLVMVATIGIAQLLFVLSIVDFVKGEGVTGGFPLPFSFQASIGNFIVGPAHFAILIFAPLVAIGVAMFFSLTPAGLAIRASAENAESARLGGIWVRRMSTMAWMVAGLLSAATAIMVAPFRGNTFAQAMGPELMVRALAAALIGGMVNLRTAFVAGIGIGVIEGIAIWNFHGSGPVELLMFGLLIVALLARVRTLRGTQASETWSTFRSAAATRIRAMSAHRRSLGRLGSVLSVVAVFALPVALNNSRSYLFTNIFIFAIVGLSLTLLSGWAGQLSLGHFALVAVGALYTARLGPEFPFPILLLVSGTTAAAVAVAIGLPALRIRGLYLAVTTLGFAVLMKVWILSHPAMGLPQTSGTFIPRPRVFGVDLDARRTFYYVVLAVLVLALAFVRNLRRSGVGRAMIAVRDNEAAAAAAGIRVTRTKLTAFAVSGFLAGIAGVLYAMNEGLLAAVTGTGGTSFDPFLSIMAVSMVIIGGLGSIKGALLGAAYIAGVPAIVGFSEVVFFLTSGIGLTIFVLYVPGGLAQTLDKAGDGLARVWASRSRRRPPEPEEAALTPPEEPDEVPVAVGGGAA